MSKQLFFILLILPSVSFALDADKPLHYEVVTGLRSTYVHRGIKLADTTLDVQFNGTFSYADDGSGEDRSLEYGVWYAGETNTGGFAETGITLRYFEKINNWTYFLGAQYRHLDNAVMKSGFELDAGLTFELNPDHKITGIVSYDTSTRGWYSELEYTGFKDLSEKSFLTYSVGASSVYNYHGREGFNDIHAKLSYTYNINDFVSLTPYLGYYHIDSDDSYALAGVWFEISF